MGQPTPGARLLPTGFSRIPLQRCAPPRRSEARFRGASRAHPLTSHDAFIIAIAVAALLRSPAPRSQHPQLRARCVESLLHEPLRPDRHALRVKVSSSSCSARSSCSVRKLGVLFMLGLLFMLGALGAEAHSARARSCTWSLHSCSRSFRLCTPSRHTRLRMRWSCTRRCFSMGESFLPLGRTSGTFS